MKNILALQDRDRATHVLHDDIPKQIGIRNAGQHYDDNSDNP